jgi:hypothetical protein
MGGGGGPLFLAERVGGSPLNLDTARPMEGRKEVKSRFRSANLLALSGGGGNQS